MSKRLTLSRLIGTGVVPLYAAAAPDSTIPQSALTPHTTQAAELATLSWTLFIGAAVIFLIVMGLLALGLLLSAKHKPRGLSAGASKRLVLLAGVAIPLLLLITLTFYSVNVTRSTLAAAPDEALNIEVIGHRWWWQVRYLDTQQQVVAETANEIHVPVGRAVRFILKSQDVIHSFWVPNLHGKTDMIPGITNVSWFRPETPGTYRGQCAEYCGVQHANMAFTVVVETAEDFTQWLHRQGQPAQEPDDPVSRRGLAVLKEQQCLVCHQIRGVLSKGMKKAGWAGSPTANSEAVRSSETTASSEAVTGAEATTGSKAVKGPDLTHLASRQTLAALTIANTKGHLGGWVLDPQNVKPGNLMPSRRMDSEDFNALLHYLQSLQ